MSVISIILILLISFLAGLDGILDQFQFHQPLVACTLIGLAAGQPAAGIMLGGTLQFLALGWANIGAAVAPDVALASTAAAVVMIKGGDFSQKGITIAYGVAVPLAIAGLALTMVVRAVSIGIVHGADAAAKSGNIRAVERSHYFALLLQGLRIVLPVALLLALPADHVKSILEAIPSWLSDGMTIGGGMVVAVGYAMILNMMATREVWPFFIIGFVLAAIPDTQITLFGLGMVGVALAMIYIAITNQAGSSNGGDANTGSDDPIGDILEDY
ncbi:PTS mannose/fructose/sorbose transporter subunit IIC [Streptococcus downei]|uniref:PTS system mannose-specific transporter subunit IIC n=1 Tax=Streptococcus downei MFe28 TaxID=764290 RepID=A0A380JBB8_STRDO|nr:PTS mannose/fructose/sorbose transporter subunit IIC [Streptococcus downei]EFQ57279.1 PTS system sorbose-specific iic component [Streptococcus downei F0415]SUN35109.1 PTS system mannose-specific transporter subunit IIC [Streptococcus downei MFe28]